MMQLIEAGRNCARYPLGRLVLSACAGESPSGGYADVAGGSADVAGGCADFDAMEQPALHANVRVIASGQKQVLTLSRLTPALIADDSGLYWCDTDGSVFAQPRGRADVVQLLDGLVRVDEAAARRSLVVGMVGSADRLYVGDGYFATNAIDFTGIGDIHAPSRLLSIPKQGGPASVRLESEDTLLCRSLLTPSASSSTASARPAPSTTR